LSGHAGSLFPHPFAGCQWFDGSLSGLLARVYDPGS